MFTGRGSGHPVSAPGGLAGLLKKPHSVRAGVGPAQHSARSLVGKPADVGWLCPPPPAVPAGPCCPPGDTTEDTVPAVLWRQGQCGENHQWKGPVVQTR